jgi:serine/threonine protein kinase
LEIRPGDVLSHFKVLEKVGEGGMGVVFRAHDLHLERDVALKVLSNRTASGEESERRFRKEALALSRLNHPNIASIYDFDRSDGISFLAMEWIPGSTLDHRLTDGPLPERTLLEYGEQISMALAYAHSEGIIHRDLKPGNLGLGADGRVKVLDFGLAKLWKPASDSSLTQTLPRLSALVGTIPYIAPEVFTGAPASVASDIYSLGAVLYELATARRAFPQSDSDALTAAIMHQPPEPPRAVNPKISPDLERVILRCLEKSPTDRYASAFDVRSDLRRIAEGLPIVSVRRRRVPQRALRIGAVALVLVGLAVLSLISGGRPPRPTAFMKVLATSPANEWAPQISPDKEWISFLSDSGDTERIWLQRVKGGDPRLLRAEAGILSPVWSPDGERIAFLVIRLKEPLLRIVPAFGGGADTTFRLPDEFMNANLVRWVGSRIYAEIRGTGFVRIDASTGAITQLMSSQAGSEALRSYFDVRSDEKEVVWSLHKGSGTTVWTSQLDGSGAEQQTFGSHNDFAPRYGSPTVIFCSSDRSGQADIWRMDLGSRTAEQITFSPNVESISDIAADESFLTFTEFREGSHLWRWDRRTGQHRQLTADALRHLFPSYSAAARRLVVQREKPVMEEQRGLRR